LLTFFLYELYELYELYKLFVVYNPQHIPLFQPPFVDYKRQKIYNGAMRKVFSLLIVFLVFLFVLNVTVLARSGCCSSHNGVRSDGCGCNDGTPLSSTCAPYYQCNSGSNQNTVRQVYEAPTSIPYIPPPTKVPLIFPTLTPVPTNTPVSTSTITEIPIPKPTRIVVNKVNGAKKVKKQITKKRIFWQWLFNR